MPLNCFGAIYQIHHKSSRRPDLKMGKIDKGVTCSVAGCTEPAIRSISAEMASEAKIKTIETRRAYLCKKHYKELKKRLKKDRRLQRWRWNP